MQFVLIVLLIAASTAGLAALIVELDWDLAVSRKWHTLVEGRGASRPATDWTSEQQPVLGTRVGMGNPPSA